MFLSQLVLKPLEVKGVPRAVCLGVGISLKNFSMKYLLCTPLPQRTENHTPFTHADFAVNTSSLQTLSPHTLTLSSLRPIIPKACAKLYLGKPVYSQEGASLGNLKDVEFIRGVAIRIFTENKSYSACDLQAVSDAVILRKKQSYPLGQRIPASVVFQNLTEKDTLVTKSILRKSIEKGTLIKLTLSLSPFHFFAD